MTQQETVASTRTRAEVSKRSYFNSEGDYSARASTATAGFRIEVINPAGENYVREHDLSEFTPEVLKAAAAYGIVTSATNTFGGKDLSFDERVALLDDRLDTFLKDEDWSAERQSGPRSSQLIEALVAVRAKANRETPQEWIDAKIAELKATPEKAKEYMANPHVAAELSRIKAEAAIARAAKLEAKAGEQATTLDILD